MDEITMKNNKLPSKLKKKNYIVMALIIAFIVLIYAVTIVKLSV